MKLEVLQKESQVSHPPAQSVLPQLCSRIPRKISRKPWRAGHAQVQLHEDAVQKLAFTCSRHAQPQITDFDSGE